MKLLVTGGRVVDPSQNVDRDADLLVVDGRVAGLYEPGTCTVEAEALNVAGMVVTPGLIDIHVHLREPGFEYKEDILSGSRAAAAGGFTRVCCMPNTNPAIDTAAVVSFIVQQSEKVGFTRVHPIAAATRGMGGEVLTEMAELKSAGAIAVSDDAFPLQNAATVRRCMEYCAMIGLPLLTHNEDKHLTQGGSMNEGLMSTELGLPGMSACAEDIAVARNIALSELTGCHLHLLHISTRGTTELLRAARAKGLKVSGEACPHHWVLTDDACGGYNTDAKMNPPLRTQVHADAVKAALADGTIQCIVTDHAPHADYEKHVEFDAAPFGILGLETSFSLVYTSLVKSGIISLSRAVEMMTIEPARILNLPDGAGTLKDGAMADIAVIDLNAEWVVDRERVQSKSHNTPFHGMTLTAKPQFTLLAGTAVRL